MKKIYGWLLLIISIICFLSSNLLTITGNVIGTNANGQHFKLIFGLVFFILSLLILTGKKSLDAIIIPTGPSKEIGAKRADRAGEEYKKVGSKILLISGGPEKELKNSQRYAIYKELRKYDISPVEIRIEGKSKNTIENVLYSIEKLKKLGAYEIGIASEPSHLYRFEDIIKQGKKEGIIDKNIRIYELKTKETPGSFAYGMGAMILNKYRLRKGLEKAAKVETPKWLKSIATYAYNIFKKK